MKECMRNSSYTFSNTFLFSSGRATNPDPLKFLDYIKRISAMLFLKIRGFLVFLALAITKAVEIIF